MIVAVTHSGVEVIVPGRDVGSARRRWDKQVDAGEAEPARWFRHIDGRSAEAKAIPPEHDYR